MLYEFLLPLTTYESAFNIFRYISFRAAGAAITSLLVCFVVAPWILARLRAMQVHQVVRAGTPDSHAGKGTTPTMGGLIILSAVVTSTLLWMQLRSKYVWLALGVTVLMGAIGFLDDYLKLKQKREGRENRGLVERYKLAGQVTIGLALGYYLWQYPINSLPGASTTLPFYKYVLIVPTIAWLYVPFVTFVMTGFSNAVNLTDGLDGLATGLIAIAMLTMAIFAYVMGRVDATEYLGLIYLRGAGELTVFCSAVFGAAVGFLWYNAHPAEVFMGDTGSLALGGSIGAVAILLKSEFLLVIVGGVFVAETVSVVIQRSAFKWRKRRFGLEYAQRHRVFLRAPIHHHFELKGWPETQVVVRFWIIGILCAFLALSTLKIR
ncbi:MAG: phospho-N-acetylmuramoyl-pentapeptide-transferase [Gemmatimonadaceae bacterium]|nr:phospho-N-acetylmuramoyl-pentapeptide-transferase [Gemmatimonadaceae bacterium]MCW5824950.1 phospho-N-acetylmuramoyl-pentapeptide-transferase [Gemmatimonadaceae bacterium]